MEQEQFFKAVDERDIYQIFFADAANRQPFMEVVGKDHKDHGERVRKVWHDKIWQECVGSSAGALDAGEPQADYFRFPIRKGNKVPFIAASFAAGSFCAAVRADQKEQRILLKGLLEKVSDR